MTAAEQHLLQPLRLRSCFLQALETDPCFWLYVEAKQEVHSMEHNAYVQENEIQLEIKYALCHYSSALSVRPHS